MTEGGAASISEGGRIDMAAAGLSTLCLVHCLALPLLGASLPLLTTWSEAEWVHKALVLTAAPLSGLSVLLRAARPGGWIFAIVAIAGLSILIAAAFVESLHEFERPLTVVGALILGGAHLVWWFKHRALKAAGECQE